jgi:hypothetical protein
MFASKKKKETPLEAALRFQRKYIFASLLSRLCYKIWASQNAPIARLIMCWSKILVSNPAIAKLVKSVKTAANQGSVI